MTGEGTRSPPLSGTPDVYLGRGYLDMAGMPWPELRGTDATAAAVQLMTAGVAPQELGFTIAAVTLLLPQNDDPVAASRLAAAVAEAVSTVGRAIQQPNNRGLLAWLNACAAKVSSDADLAACLDHLTAVDRQYAMLVALQPPPGSPPEPPGPG